MSLQVRNQTSGILERVAGFNDTDSILSPVSQNPISNKAVYNALLQKIDKTVTDLVNYYDKSQVYSKPEVRALIGAINTLTIEVVSALPTQDISTTTIYFVGPAAGTNNYDEYVYVGGNWVQIGDTTIDLSSYVTSTQLTTVLQDYYTQSQTDALFADYYDKDATDDLLDAKQDVLDFDNEPIAGSENPVTSAGIKTALDNILISGNGGSIIKVHHTAGVAAQGDTVTASKGSYSVSSTFDVSGDAIIIGFGEIGDITITATNGSETGVKIINIPCFSNYSVEIMYGLDYKSWLIAGGLNPTYYSSLDEVLADEEAIRKLMTKHASVDYLASLLNITDEMIDTIINNDICAKWINLRGYAFDKLSANINVKAYMDEADKYGYGEWALMPQVPTMTSNTAPYGEVISSTAYSSYPAYYAFDGNSGTMFSTDVSSPVNQYCGFKFQKPIKINEISFIENIPQYKGYRRMYTYNIEASNDNTNWVKLAENVDVPEGKDTERIYYAFENENAYLYYRIYCVTGTTQAWRLCFAELQFYAWQPKGNIPVMTGNTSPYGVASASSENATSSVSTTQAAWKAFTGTLNADPYDSWLMSSSYSTGWLQYKFTNPVCAKKVWFSNRNYSDNEYGRTQSFKIQASNDGTNFTDLTDIITRDNSKNAPLADETVILNNQNYYLYYRLTILSSFTSTYGGCGELQIYGREMKVSVPAMTSNIAPYGTAITNSIYSTTYDAWKAFDRIVDGANNYWRTANNVLPGWVGYNFGKPTIIKSLGLTSYTTAQTSSPNTKDFAVQGSNDGETWTTIKNFVNETPSTSTTLFEFNENETLYNYYRVYITTVWGGTNANLAELNFFGFDYSEYDWDTENPRTYIYDHGLELKTVNGIISDSTSVFTKEPNNILIKVGGNYTEFYIPENINLTSYNLIRGVFGLTSLKDSAGSIWLGYLSSIPSGTTWVQPDGYTFTNTGDRFSINCNISSVNQTKYIGGGRRGGSGIIETIEELWLE